MKYMKDFKMTIAACQVITSLGRHLGIREGLGRANACDLICQVLQLHRYVIIFGWPYIYTYIHTYIHTYANTYTYIYICIYIENLNTCLPTLIVPSLSLQLVTTIEHCLQNLNCVNCYLTICQCITEIWCWPI